MVNSESSEEEKTEELSNNVEIDEVKCKLSSADKVNWWLALVPLFLFAGACLTIKFLVVHREITFSQARHIRAVLIRDRIWRWWHIGLVPWFTINWMLMTFDEKKDALSARIKSGKRAIEAFCVVRQALVKDGDFRRLFELWNEFKVRDEQGFAARDRKMFMTCMGSVFNGPVRIFLEEALLLRLSDYLVLKYLCCKTSRFLSEQIRSQGIVESTLITYFINNKAECCAKIQQFRQMLLEMARTYVDNMIGFCLENKLELASHLWAQAGKCIVRLQDMEPNDTNEVFIREELGRFILFFEQASGPVYVRYQELDRLERERQLVIANAAANGDVLMEAEVQRIVRWQYLHREKVGRFRFKWVDNALTIKDVEHRESDHRAVEFVGITAPKSLDIIEALIKEYADGYGKLILPLEDRNWQASMEGAAAEFIRRETETWNDARPNDQKEVKKLHNRHRRVILDGGDLRAK